MLDSLNWRHLRPFDLFLLLCSRHLLLCFLFILRLIHLQFLDVLIVDLLEVFLLFRPLLPLSLAPSLDFIFLFRRSQ